MATSLNRELKPPLLIDGPLVATTLALVGISLVMIYSTTAILSQEKFGDALFFVKRQSVAALLGVAFMYLCSRLDVEVLRRYSGFFLPLAVLLLVVTLIPGLGDRAGGAQRWLALGPVRFQPGEFVKVMFVLFFAGYLARHETRLATFEDGVLKPLIFVGLIGGLFLVQPDFGSTAVIVAVALCMAAVTGIRLRYLVMAGLVALLALGALVAISPYRMARIVSFLSPWSDASGRGYQLIQSLIAIGSGQTTGVGLGESKQKLFYLPAAHTDFIFSMIAEELGFVGAVVLIALFLVVFWRGIRLARKVADDTFLFSLVVGLTGMIVMPALLNIGVVTGLLPTKGLVLPLVGYGGSSLLACLMAIGIMLAVERSFRGGT